MLLLFAILWCSVLTSGPYCLYQVEQSLSHLEKDVLHKEGYQVVGGKQVRLVLMDDQTLLLKGKVNLVNGNGERCIARQKLYLPLQNLQFPLLFTEDVSPIAAFEYGPYLFPLFLPDDQVKAKLRSLASTGVLRLSLPQSNAAIARQNGFSYVVHSTRPENLVSILRDGRVECGREIQNCLRGDPVGNDQFVFCSLVKGELDKENVLQLTGNRLPVLVFEADEILDQGEWHANIGHPYGAFHLFSTSDKTLFPSAHCKDPFTLDAFLKHPSCPKRNEIVLHEPLSIQGICCIYVAKGEKEQLLAAIEKENISRLHQEWETLIREVEPLAVELKFVGPHQFWAPLAPYSRNSHDIVRYALCCGELSERDWVSLLKSEYPGMKPFDRNVGILFQALSPLQSIDFMPIAPRFRKCLYWQ